MENQSDKPVKYEKLGNYCPTTRNPLECMIKDEVSGNEDKLIYSEGEYDSCFGDMEKLTYERPDGSTYLVTLGFEPCDRNGFRWEEELGATK